MQAFAENENNTELPETSKTEDLINALAESKARCEANLAGWQRAQADYANLKRISEQEKADICKYANAGLLANILPVIDDLERAMAMVPEDLEGNKWVQGLTMINQKLVDTLEKQGITQIKAVGQEFDPRIMDAITCCPGEKDIVVQEVEKGYKLNDRVIRPAKVIVGTGEDKEE
jgi:molecular chaperone GrpE